MTNIKSDSEYKKWLSELKLRIRQSQIKAAVKVNVELLKLYWSLGKDIVTKQTNSQWGDGIIKQLSIDLKREFPKIQGFSERNINYIRQWYLFYNEHNTIVQQAVAQLETTEDLQQLVTQIPWGHNLKIISKCKSVEEAIFYIHKTMEFGWSRDMLDQHIKLGEYSRVGNSVTNFSRLLPAVQSDLAAQTLKDPYNFDFLTLTDGFKERELENALTDNITKFLIELGTGFAYVGRQVPLQVGDKEFFIDLLFYHLKLRCYVVIELKAVDFIPEFAGKLSFYLSAVNDLLCHPTDNPTIGLMICKSKDRYIAEYALKDINQPMGVSEYELTRLFPKDFKGSLPTIDEIEAELDE
ncbi:PDDEXK nuclease domain-containing protein [uncultured Bacteroides sp.]|uniref:PDDEXK nuclease domain-containing protein n=1 Tax=uncultured Bacteroides sp. TaxID=162156 RepID=UPI002AA5F451|nr:PDDEXK nuclease domain-containing protein [uncultured Bacteroides sp.]